MHSKLNRVIDVNLNRSREALRVCEDITRFVLEDKALTVSIKNIRHKISSAANELFDQKIISIKSRNTKTDFGKEYVFDKVNKTGFKSVFYNNAHRAQESIRALEEFSKMGSSNLYKDFKALRFKVYNIEKKAIKKLQALCSN